MVGCKKPPPSDDLFIIFHVVCVQKLSSACIHTHICAYIYIYTSIYVCSFKTPILFRRRQIENAAVEQIKMSNFCVLSFVVRRKLSCIHKNKHTSISPHTHLHIHIHIYIHTNILYTSVF